MLHLDLYNIMSRVIMISGNNSVCLPVLQKNYTSYNFFLPILFIWNYYPIFILSPPPPPPTLCWKRSRSALRFREFARCIFDKIGDSSRGSEKVDLFLLLVSSLLFILIIILYKEKHQDPQFASWLVVFSLKLAVLREQLSPLTCQRRKQKVIAYSGGRGARGSPRDVEVRSLVRFASFCRYLFVCRRHAPSAWRFLSRILPACRHRWPIPYDCAAKTECEYLGVYNLLFAFFLSISLSLFAFSEASSDIVWEGKRTRNMNLLDLSVNSHYSWTCNVYDCSFNIYLPIVRDRWSHKL